MADDVGTTSVRPRRSRARVAGGVVVVLLLVLGGVLAYQVVRTAMALRSVEADARTLQQQLRERDVTAALTTSERLRDHARTARTHSDGWLWAAATRIPLLGDDADAVRSLARAVDLLGEQGPGAVGIAGRLDSDDLRTPDGGFRLEVLDELAPEASSLADAARAAADEVADVDPGDLVGPLSGPAADAVSRIEQVRSSAVGGAVATRVLPEMLGGEGTRRLLLVTQNNAEIRSTGGLPGSVAVLTARDGRVRLGFQGSSGDVMGDQSPVAAFEPGEEEVFGPLLLTDFRDTNFTPDFPRAAALMADYVERAGPRVAVDSVVAIDPVTLARILDVTGPVEAAGVRLSGDDAVQRLLFDAYQDLPAGTPQDRFFQAAARGILDVLLGADTSGTSLLGTLGEAVDQRRLLVWNRDDALQGEVAPYAAAGALPVDTGRPEVGLYLNDGTGAKMQYFLRSEHQIQSLGCRVDGRQVVRTTSVMANVLDRPVSGLTESVTGDGSRVPRGTMRMQLRLFAPTGGELVALEVDGRRVDVAQADVYGRQVTQFPVELAPGQRTEIVAQMIGGPDQPGDPRMQWTPGIVWGPSDQVARSQC